MSCRLKTSADYLHAQEKEHDFLLDALGGSRFDAKSDRLLAVFELIQSNGKTSSRPRNSWRNNEIFPSAVVGISPLICISGAEGTMGVGSMVASSVLSAANRS